MNAQQPVLIEHLNLVENRLIEAMQNLESRLTEAFTSAVQKGFTTLSLRMDNLEDRFGIVEQRLGKVEVAVEDMRDELAAAMHAIDRDAVTIVDHERRIVRLEGTVIAA